MGVFKLYLFCASRSQS